jgi:hypothetical protein
VEVAGIHAEIDRLERDGVRFSIAAGTDGFVARVGDYLNGPTPSREVLTIEEAVRWVATVTRQPQASSISRSV